MLNYFWALLKKLNLELILGKKGYT